MNNQETGTLRASKDFWFACVDMAVLCDKTLTQTARFVFAILCSFAGMDNRGVWPKNETVADVTGLSIRTVIRAYNELECKGIIARSDRFKDGRQTSSYTRIVGHNAPCYSVGVSDMTGRDDTHDIHGYDTHDIQNEIQNNDIKDSLTREANLPASEELPIPPEQESPIRQEDSFSPEDVPEIMRSTAEYLLFKTGRKTLTESEISALRELSAHQYPSRVQKEIDRACERFRRKGNSLETLTFCYIAGALRNQPSLKKKTREKSKPNPYALTQAEIDATRPEMTEEELDREFEQLRAEMLEEGC